MRLRRDWGCLRLCLVPDWPQTPAGLGRGCAASGGAGRCPCPVTDWPQSPAGLGFGAVWRGSASTCPAVTLRVTDGLNRRPGCWVRGFSGAWVGWGRAGVPPHKLQGAGSVALRRPCVQFAAGAPRPVPTPRSRTRPTAGGWMGPSPMQGLSTVTTVNAFARHKDRWVTACLFPPTGGTSPTRRKGGVVPGCPRSKLPCSAALKRLTPHLAVCEEVPRCGPARPNRRTHRDPHSPAGD